MDRVAIIMDMPFNRFKKKMNRIINEYISTNFIGYRVFVRYQ